MAGIYIHIPYCKQACHYCNFHFTTRQSGIEDYVKALLIEMSVRKHELNNEPVKTIYIGGGTPSLLPEHSLQTIGSALHECFDLSHLEEFTVETNPDDVDGFKLKILQSIGVNRISIGVQSFFDEHLELMNRSHGSAQAVRAVRTVQDSGLTNVTIDLIYALPGLSMDQWHRNLDYVSGLGIHHLSCYNLTLEERTALMHLVKNKKIELPDEEIAAAQFAALRQWAKQNGFIPYEISNLAKPGFESRHNTAYWNGSKYLGFGPSAHSFDGTTRKANKANTPAYIKALLTLGTAPSEEELLTTDQRYNEFVMTSLRTIYGLDVNILEEQFGQDVLDHFLTESASLIKENLIEQEDSVIRLTDQGYYFADAIASKLFIVD